MAISGIMQRWKGKTVHGSSAFVQAGGTGEPAAAAPQQVFALTGNLFTLVSAAGVGNGADETEDLLGSFVLQPNALDTASSTGKGNARGLSIYAAGSVANNAHTKTIKLYFGTQSVSLLPMASTADAWAIEMVIYKTGASTQFIQWTAYDGIATTSLFTMGNVAGTQTDTSAITIKATGESSAVSANDILLNLMTVAFFN